MHRDIERCRGIEIFREGQREREREIGRERVGIGEALCASNALVASSCGLSIASYQAGWGLSVLCSSGP